jgi:hypothetical protein
LVGNVVGIGSFIPTTSLVGNVVGNATFPTKIGPVPTKYFVGSKENSCSEVYFFVTNINGNSLVSENSLQ